MCLFSLIRLRRRICRRKCRRWSLWHGPPIPRECLFMFGRCSRNALNDLANKVTIVIYIRALLPKRRDFLLGNEFKTGPTPGPGVYAPLSYLRVYRDRRSLTSSNSLNSYLDSYARTQSAPWHKLYIQIILPYPPTPAMSQAPTTAAASLRFQAIFYVAVQSYQKQTKNDLIVHPLASQLQSCDSTSAILAILQDQVQEFDKSRSGDERLTKWLSPIVNVLSAFSAVVSGGVGLVSREIILKTSSDFL